MIFAILIIIAAILVIVFGWEGFLAIVEEAGVRVIEESGDVIESGLERIEPET